jgi:hypothetical protein
MEALTKKMRELYEEQRGFNLSKEKEEDVKLMQK